MKVFAYLFSSRVNRDSCRISFSEDVSSDDLPRSANELCPSDIGTYKSAERFSLEICDLLNERDCSESVEVVENPLKIFLREYMNGCGQWPAVPVRK